MSFILDALKKSETDRQQQSNTEFAAVPVSPRAAAVPRWLWVVGLLLAINIAVLLGLLLRPDSPGPSNTQSSATIAAESIANEPLQQAATQPPSFEDKVAAAQRNAPARRVDSAGTIESDLISQNPSAVPSDELYPTLQEVRVKGAVDLPDLHLDIHVYNSEPEDRFVFINMSKLREGSQLAEGPVVAEIRPDGVVLGHQGQYFILPRD